MMNTEWYKAYNDGRAVKLSDIPVVAYGQFAEDVVRILADPRCHTVAYFAVPSGGGFRFYCLVADDGNSQVYVASHILSAPFGLESLTPKIKAMHAFEREIAELYGIVFKGHPWAKPLRFPSGRFDPLSRIDNYPFYDIKGGGLHLVNVGPVHAGIIEPGAFHFVCDGEQVLHLEIALGYQHRGIERLITSTTNRLRQICIAESIAGDSAVGHSVAMALAMEQGAAGSALDRERVIALEMERMAMGIADTGALCMDIAYQIGQVACEALRTIVINATQRWCGNRFGKGLVRPFGTHFPLDAERCEDTLKSLGEVIARYRTVAKDILSTPTVLARFEEICTVTAKQAAEAGAVGMAARSVGMERDVRVSHSFTGSPEEGYTTEKGGDLLSRLKLRMADINRSYDIIRREIAALSDTSHKGHGLPDYDRLSTPESLVFSLVEGWRGQICHVAITDERGNFGVYKIYDPSFHNWTMLALSVRGAQISDFPLSNKSYNLSYAGHDL